MPPRVTFRSNDPSQVPFQAIAKPLADLLGELTNHQFRIVIDALNWWSDYALFNEHHESWANRVLPKRSNPSELDARIHSVVTSFYKDAQVKAIEGISVTLPNGRRRVMTGDEVLGKFRAEVLEQYARNARAQFYADPNSFGSNCVFLLDGKPALQFILDVDVAGWRGQECGEAASCKCRPTGFTTSGLIELKHLKRRLEDEFGGDRLLLYLVTFDSTDAVLERLWYLADGYELAIEDYHPVGVENLPELQTIERYRYLGA